MSQILGMWKLLDKFEILTQTRSYFVSIWRNEDPTLRLPYRMDISDERENLIVANFRALTETACREEAENRIRLEPA